MEKIQKKSNIHFSSERLNRELLSIKYVEEIFKELTDEVTKYIRVPTPSDIQQEKDRIISSKEKYEQWTDINFVVTDKAGDFIWTAGILDLHTRTPEVGLRLKQSARGKGYGKEMIDTIIKRLEEYKDFDYIIYDAHVENIATRKIAERIWGVLQLDADGKEKIFTEWKFDKSSSHSAVQYRIYKK